MLTESLPASWQVGQPLKGGVAHVRCAQTTPPKRFTDGTLISAMTHIHRFVHSDADRKILRESKGIGTERTRDAIIERLSSAAMWCAIITARCVPPSEASS